MSDEVKPTFASSLREHAALLDDETRRETPRGRTVRLSETSAMLIVAAGEIERLQADSTAIPCERGQSVPPLALTPGTLLEAILNLHRSTMQPILIVRLLHSAELAGIVERVVSPECLPANTSVYAGTMRIIPEIVWTAHAYDWRVVNGSES